MSDEIEIRGRYQVVIPGTYALCYRSRKSGVDYILGHFYTECHTPEPCESWSWASLPGLRPGRDRRWARYDPKSDNIQEAFRVWLTSERRPV